MMDVVVREFARLTTAAVTPSLDQHTVTQSAFGYLCDLAARMGTGGAKLVQVEDRVSLRLDNFVGVIQTPCGTRLEILPKHTGCAKDADASRRLLKKMLLSVMHITARDVGYATIELLKNPLSEWVMQQFLLKLDRLIKRGIRFDYQLVQEEQRFLRGRLDIDKQQRQPPGRSHLFQIEHDVFLPDRPENRLLKSALERICRATQTPENWRLAHELAVVMAEIPSSMQIPADFMRWSNDRLMAHYQSVRPWCELVLGEHMPTALKGTSQGISLLFPMERLFQEYVANVLEEELPSNTHLERQTASKYLCQHDGRGFFRLQPDLIIRRGDQSWVLDTKWKIVEAQSAIDVGVGRTNYGLSQSDFYQLFVYGHRYLNGCGNMLLIYPKTRAFESALPPFRFSDDLTLWVVPFDLDTDILGVPLLEGLKFNCLT